MTMAFGRKFLRYLYSKKTMIFYECNYENIEDWRDPGGNLLIKELEPADYGDFSLLLEHQRSRETIFKPIFDLEVAKERIREGERCFICRADGEIAGYVWFAPDRKYILEIQAILQMAKQEIYSYNAYVLERFRGRDVIAQLQRFGRGRLSGDGFQREICATMAWNSRPDHILLKKLNMQVIGTVSAGYFMTYRFFINNCKEIRLVNHPGHFEFFGKLWYRVRGLSSGSHHQAEESTEVGIPLSLNRSKKHR